MRAPQYAAALVAIALLLFMYFGCPTQAPEMAQAEASRNLQISATSIESMIRSAQQELKAGEIATIIEIEERLETEPPPVDSLKRQLLEELAGQWYRLGYPGISAGYAQQIAEQTNDEQDWSVAGTSYTICVQRAEEEKVRSFCYQQAEQAYLNAISLNPEELDHKINLALTHMLDPQQPMRGIMRLRELQESHPEDPRPLISLGRLALQTNQLERAAERLDAALELDPTNQAAICLRAETYQRAGQLVDAARLSELCLAN
ncbi:MAG: hypothetical protein AAF433_13850 [Bacteroidota bacterium]